MCSLESVLGSVLSETDVDSAPKNYQLHNIKDLKKIGFVSCSFNYSDIL